MKNESLISEIYRIQEVMGIPNKKLLLEQAWVEDLLAALSKLAKNFDDEFDTLLANVRNESLEKNVRANNLDKLIRKAKNMGDEDVLRVINDVLTSPDGSLINSIKNIVSSEDTSALISQIAKQEDSTVKKLYDSLELDTFNAGTGDDIIDMWYKNSLKKELKKSFDAEKVSIRKTKPEETSTPKEDDVPPVSGPKNPQDALYDWQNWDGKEMTFDEDAIKTLANNTDRKWFEKNITDNVVLTTDRLKRIQRLFKAATQTENTALKNKLIGQIVDDFEFVFKRSAYDYNNMYSWVKDVQKQLYRTRGKNQQATALNEIINAFKEKSNVFQTFGAFSPIDTTLGTFNSSLKSTFETIGQSGAVDFVKEIFRNVSNAFKYMFTSKELRPSTLDVKGAGKKLDVVGYDSLKAAEVKGLMSNPATNWFFLGSRRGLPTLKNPYYQNIIKKYNYKTAWGTYLMEAFLVNYLKWQLIEGLFETLRNGLGWRIEKSNVELCLLSRENQLKENPTTDTTELPYPDACPQTVWFKWALDYSSSGFEDKDKFKKELIENLVLDGWGEGVNYVNTIIPGFWDEMLAAVINGLEIWDDPNSFRNLDVVLAQRIEQAKKKSQEIEDGMKRASDTAEDTADNFDQSRLRLFPKDLLRLIPEGSHSLLKRVGVGKFKLDYSSFGDNGNYIITKQNNKWVISDPRLGQNISISGEKGFFTDMPEQ